MKKLIITLLVALTFTCNANAQFFSKLGKIISKAAQNVTEQTSTNAVEKIIDAKVKADNAELESQKTQKVVYDFIDMGEDSITYIEPLFNEKATVDDVKSYMPTGYDTTLSTDYNYYYESRVTYMYHFINRRFLSCIVSVLNVDYDSCLAWFDSHYKRTRHDQTNLKDIYEYSTPKSKTSVSLMFVTSNGISNATIMYNLEP